MRRREFNNYHGSTVGMMAGIALMGLLVGAVSAADALTAGDWQYLRRIGYDEHSYALEAASKGQRKHLHKLINNPRLSDTRKANIIDIYLKALPIGAVPK
jgi:hypothetical protein